jgi:hypothetical protein
VQRLPAGVLPNAQAWAVSIVGHDLYGIVRGYP